MRHDLGRACSTMNELVNLFKSDCLLDKMNLGFALRERAKIAVKIGQHDTVASDLDEVIVLWSGLAGMERELKDAYVLRTSIALFQGNHEVAEELLAKRVEMFG